MTEKWTKGPWAVTSVGNCHAVHPAASNNERDDICRVTPHNYHPDGCAGLKAETIANANLIAAAPEMYGALTVALDALSNIADEGIDENTFNEGGIGYEAVQSINAAIAKARGEG